MKTLPFEIFQIIDTFLYQDERVICMTVCWSWYNTFKRLLYRNVTLDSQHHSQLFFSTLESPSQVLDSIAPHVRSLDLAFCPDNSRTDRPLTKIALLLPQLVSLCLHNDYNDGGLSLFHYLTTLKLTVNRDGFDTSSLSHLSKLHTLSIDWKNKTVEMDDFEIIHSYLIQLQFLSLNVRKVSWTSSRKPKISASRLVNLSIESQDYIYTIEPLFLYVAYKYPLLNHFSLKTHSATSLLSLEQEENGSALLDRYHAYITFAQQCRNLDTLVLYNIHLDSILLEALETVGVRLKKLGVDTIYGLSRSTFELMIRIGKSCFTSLDLMASLRTRNTRLLYDSLSCLHLTDLSLARQANSISLKKLLVHCHYLERCTFRDSVICLNDQHNNGVTFSRNHRLKELVLEKVIFESCSLFDYLSRQCKKLTRLSLLNSICAADNSSHTVYLDMPYSSLMLLNIDRLYIGKYTRKKEDQIQRLSLRVEGVGREMNYELIDLLSTKWHEKEYQLKVNIQPLKYGPLLSVCCQSVDRLFMNGQRLI